MNVVFWALIILGMVLFWFLSCGVFKILGKFFCKIFNDAKDAMNEETQENTEENFNENKEGENF